MVDYLRDTMADEPQPQPTFSTAQLIASMLKGRAHVSDLIFSPGRNEPTSPRRAYSLANRGTTSAQGSANDAGSLGGLRSLTT